MDDRSGGLGEVGGAAALSYGYQYDGAAAGLHTDDQNVGANALCIEYQNGETGGGVYRSSGGAAGGLVWEYQGGEMEIQAPVLACGFQPRMSSEDMFCPFCKVRKQMEFAENFGKHDSPIPPS